VNKRALIVDDSNTARQVLSNRLKRYGIDVDARESAAAAIDYLYDNAPDAIFMDYEMPGMDGFQALKVIKSNPNTALIPVMMYTSREGGLALSQARALGAVGVLPKQVESQDLEKVLYSLHLMPEQESLVHGFRDSELEVLSRAQRPDNVHPIAEAERHPGRVEMVSLPMDDLREPAEGTNGQRRWVRRELNQHEERLREGLSKQIDGLRGELSEFAAGLGEPEPRQGPLLLGRLAVLSLLAGLAILFYFTVFSPWAPALKGLAEQNAEVRDLLAEQDRRLDQMQQPAAMASSDSDYGNEPMAAPLRLLEWAANQGTGFAYGEVPFSDRRALWLSELIEQLKAVNFRGTIELRASYGNFCLWKGNTGDLKLAPPGLDVNNCVFSADQDRGLEGRSDQSVSFANNIDVEAARSDGAIDILLLTSGYNDPQIPYPPVYEVKTAGDWNRIAGLNQRIWVSLYSSE